MILMVLLVVLNYVIRLVVYFYFVLFSVLVEVICISYFLMFIFGNVKMEFGVFLI